MEQARYVPDLADPRRGGRVVIGADPRGYPVERLGRGEFYAVRAADGEPFAEVYLTSRGRWQTVHGLGDTFEHGSRFGSLGDAALEAVRYHAEGRRAEESAPGSFVTRGNAPFPGRFATEAEPVGYAVLTTIAGDEHRVVTEAGVPIGTTRRLGPKRKPRGWMAFAHDTAVVGMHLAARAAVAAIVARYEADFCRPPGTAG